VPPLQHHQQLMQQLMHVQQQLLLQTTSNPDYGSPHYGYGSPGGYGSPSYSYSASASAAGSGRHHGHGLVSRASYQPPPAAAAGNMGNTGNMVHGSLSHSYDIHAGGSGSNSNSNSAYNSPRLQLSANNRWGAALHLDLDQHLHHPHAHPQALPQQQPSSSSAAIPSARSSLVHTGRMLVYGHSSSSQASSQKITGRRAEPESHSNTARPGY
jgi:hypothetical protein